MTCGTLLLLLRSIRNRWSAGSVPQGMNYRCACPSSQCGPFLCSFLQFQGRDRRRTRRVYGRSEEHTSELQSLMRISYAVFCLKQKTLPTHHPSDTTHHHKRHCTPTHQTSI